MVWAGAHRAYDILKTSYLTPENVQLVRAAVEQSPIHSVRRYSVALGISDSSLRRCALNIGLNRSIEFPSLINRFDRFEFPSLQNNDVSRIDLRRLRQLQKSV
ncbi:hypothetical protein J437_LFUL006111 [Ladona fulva]|uniref:Uncharacterized protein n=1 Tax=Ladona fulva TaxID=123851 RepID=A0A8K0P413_LADFU|nr:hypothetical protein J437_LFUL006111 [Ladona fulva]